MDITALKLAIDLPQLRPFRELQEVLGDFSRALAAWFLLYQDLAYRMKEGQPAGRFPVGEQAQVIKCLVAAEADEARRGKMFEALVQSNLLRIEGDHYVCPRFIADHAGGEMTPQMVSRLGGYMRSFNAKQKNLRGAIFQQLLLILPDKFVDEHGEPLPHETKERVMRLIITCDNALSKSDRPPSGYTEGLIQNAQIVLRKFDDEQIDIVARHIALHRHHPSVINMTTEKLLPIFGEILQQILPT